MLRVKKQSWFSAVISELQKLFVPNLLNVFQVHFILWKTMMRSKRMNNQICHLISEKKKNFCCLCQPSGYLAPSLWLPLCFLRWARDSAKGRFQVSTAVSTVCRLVTRFLLDFSSCSKERGKTVFENVKVELTQSSTI